MKTQRDSFLKRGFTLMELMVAMAITTIIVTVLVSITSIAIDTWNRSRSELRAARQAKAMVDTMARDFEALVTRTGNDNEWLYALSDAPEGGSTNAATLVFFTAATDRYDGQIGVDGTDLGGDVSCVGYKLEWKDPISAGGSSKFKTYVLNRYLVDPKPTFDNLLGQPKLGDTFLTSYGANLSQKENFVCENVFQFTVAFNVEVTSETGDIENKLVTITPSGDSRKFTITGNGIVTEPLDDTLAGGRVTAVSISLSVLTDNAVSLVDKKANDAEWLAKNTYQYSKLIQLPGM